ncbi:MAG TPA: 6,7-dimethyl-8-ribityllumazine synthase [candidate division Zixibacteria bacterium]|nr:6,7-dimethyl-8-ribityllumazine synthase [candidate division Zixibacteria bacterium]
MGKDHALETDAPHTAPDGSRLRIAVIVSDYNSEITSALLEDALAELRSCGVADENIFQARVPGAFELPVAAQAALQRGDIDAVICLGCVIRGETSHYDVICDSISHALPAVALKFNRPVIAGVLTTENIAQARARAGAEKGPKGRQAARAALAMCRTLRDLGAG